MAKLVNLPNGKQGSFPDDMSWDEIQSIVQKQFPPTEVKQEEQQPQSLLQKAGGYAQKYINEPTQELGREALGLGAGAGQGLANVGVGTRNILAKGANLIPGVNIQMAKSFDTLPKNINTEAGELFGSILGGNELGAGLNAVTHIEKIPQIANAIKKASSILGKSPASLEKAVKVSSSIGKNALTGAAMSPDELGLGAALGAGGTALGAGLGYAAPKIANKLGFGLEPGKETIKGLKYEDVAPSVEAAERLGTPLRPSEATRNPYIAGQEGRFTRTSEAAKENVEQGMARTESEKKAINKLLSAIYSPTAANNKKINDLYQSSARWNLKPEIVNKLKEDPLIDNAIKEVSKNPAWKRDLGNTPENNIAYLDRVKRALYDKEKGLKVDAPGEANQYADARNNLVKVMDEAVPDYKKARELAELKSTRKDIKKAMKEEEIGGSAFFNKFIKNDNEFKKLQQKLRNRPEAQAQLNDMKAAWHSLINIEKPSTASYQSEKAINQARGSLQKVLEMWNQLTGKKSNLEAIRYIRGNKWVKDVKEAGSAGDKKKLEETFSNILGKIMPAGYEELKRSD